MVSFSFKSIPKHRIRVFRTTTGAKSDGFLSNAPDRSRDTKIITSLIEQHIGVSVICSFDPRHPKSWLTYYRHIVTHLIICFSSHLSTLNLTTSREMP